MNTDKYEITITPATYKGWKLGINPVAHNGEIFNARLGTKVLTADTLQGLLIELRETEKVALKIEPPIAAYKLNDYNKTRTLISIHTVIRDEFYFTEEDEGERRDNLSVLKPKAEINTGTERSGLYIAADEHTEGVYEQLAALQKKMDEIHRKARKLRQTLKPITDAQVLLAARKGAK
jgi:hypothetical protein